MSENTFTPPANVASAAKRGLELRRKFKRGGTSVGAARAGQLAGRNPVSASVIKRMVSFFARHAVDAEGKDWNNESKPSNGKIANLLWGGSAGKAWANAMAKKIDSGNKSVKEEYERGLAVDLFEERFADQLIVEDAYREPESQATSRIERVKSFGQLKNAIRIAFANNDDIQAQLATPIAEYPFKRSGAWLGDDQRPLTGGQREAINREILPLLEKPSDELTDAERELIRQYSGFGGTSGEIEGSSNVESGVEYDFYTRPDVALFQAKLVNKLIPIKQGDTILEPSCGNGVFFDVLPNGVEKIGVELDSRTAAVAQRIHGDSAEIRNQPLELYHLEGNPEVDHVVGNAPFGPRGDIKLRNADDPKEKNLDRYFLKRCLMQIKAGGMMCLQVHSGVFHNPTYRDFRLKLELLGKFMGAVRLPNTSYAHTGSNFASPDILIFQRHAEPFKKALQGVFHSNLTDEEIITLLTACGLYNENWVNGAKKYFIANRRHMLGEEVEIPARGRTTRGELRSEILDDIWSKFNFEQYDEPNAEPLDSDLIKRTEKKPAPSGNLALTPDELILRMDRQIRTGATKIVDGNLYILRASTGVNAVDGENEDRPYWQLINIAGIADKVAAINLIADSVSKLRALFHGNDPSVTDKQKAIIEALKAYQKKFGVALFEDPAVQGLIKQYPDIEGIIEATTLQESKQTEDGGEDRYCYLLSAEPPDDSGEEFSGNRPEIEFLRKNRQMMGKMTEQAVIGLLGAEAGQEMLKLLFESKFVFPELVDGNLVFVLKENYLVGRVTVLRAKLEEERESATSEAWRNKFAQALAELEKARTFSEYENIDVQMTSNFIKNDQIQRYIDATYNARLSEFIKDKSGRGISSALENKFRVYKFDKDNLLMVGDQMPSDINGNDQTFNNWDEFFTKFREGRKNVQASLPEQLEDYTQKYMSYIYNEYRYGIRRSLTDLTNLNVVRLRLRNFGEDQDLTTFRASKVQAEYSREFVWSVESAAQQKPQVQEVLNQKIGEGVFEAGEYIYYEELQDRILSGQMNNVKGFIIVDDTIPYGRSKERPFGIKDHGDVATIYLNNLNRVMAGGKPLLGNPADKMAFEKDFHQNFRDWLDENDNEQRVVERSYDERNNDVLKTSNMDYPVEIKGWNSKVQLRSVQWQAIHHLLKGQKGIAALGVGFGKTLAAVGLTGVLLQEKRAKRVWCQVPNNKVKDWSEEYKLGLPNIELLAAKPEDAKNKQTRMKILNQLANGNASVLVIPETIGTEVQLSAAKDEEIVEALFQDQMQFVTDGSPKQRKKYATNLRKTLDTSQARTASISFEEFKCDAIIVDELHREKSLFSPYRVSTQISQLNKNADSTRGISLLKKEEYLRQTNPKGKPNTYGLTATPMTNSPLEFWNMLAHIDAEALRANGINDLGSFVRQFCILKMEMQPNTLGEGLVARQVLKGFRNLDLLRKVFYDVVDYQVSREALEADSESTSGEKGRKAEVHDETLAPTQMLQDVTAFLRAQYENPELEEGEEEEMEVEEGEEEQEEGAVAQTADQKRREIWQDLQTAALDLEMLDPVKYKDAPNSKLDKMIENVMRHWTESGSGQLIFCDRMNASRGRGDGTYNLHEKIKTQLVDAGFPANKIALVNGAAKGAGDKLTKAQARKMGSYIDQTCEKYNGGELRLLIGNTPCMGEGLNLQADSIAVHHFDIPYRPSDLVQRNGRVDRQGNKQMTTHLYNYSTAGTLDAYSLSQIKLKANWLQELLQSDVTVWENPETDALANDPLTIQILLAESAGDLEALEDLKMRRDLIVTQAERKQREIDAADNFKSLNIAMNAMLKMEPETPEYRNAMKRVNKFRRVLRDNPEFKMQELLEEDAEPFMIWGKPKDVKTSALFNGRTVIRKGDYYHNLLGDLQSYWKVVGFAPSTQKVFLEAVSEYEPKKDPDDENEPLRPRKGHFYALDSPPYDGSAKSLDRIGNFKKVPRAMLDPETLQTLTATTSGAMHEMSVDQQVNVVQAKLMTELGEDNDSYAMRDWFRGKLNENNIDPKFLLNGQYYAVVYGDDIYVGKPLPAGSEGSDGLKEEYGAALTMQGFVLQGYHIKDRTPNHEKFYRHLFKHGTSSRILTPPLGETPEKFSSHLIKHIQKLRTSAVFQLTASRDDSNDFREMLTNDNDFIQCWAEHLELFARTYGKKVMSQGRGGGKPDTEWDRFYFELFMPLSMRSRDFHDALTEYIRGKYPNKDEFDFNGKTSYKFF